MRIKHWHKWRRYCTFNGRIHGTQSICEVCGSRKGFGAEVGGKERLVSGYARRGESMKWPS